jgi:phosphoribosylglycinamide formyltransferase-1|tara:strand:- start:6396 stop:6881 length:486 start_codon:yes stop_codon:yes gene_type:complete
MSQRLAILASGEGTLTEAIIGDGIPVSLLFSDRPCRAAQVVGPRAGVPSIIIERDDFSESFNREHFTEFLLSVLLAHEIEVVVMAGFKTVLSTTIFTSYEGMIINSHPSLLPKFKGANAVRDTLQAGEIITGCTIHLVSHRGSALDTTVFSYSCPSFPKAL